MPFYPALNSEITTRDIIEAFRGYNHNLRIGADEFYDMKNLTSDYFPVLSPRGERGTYLTPSTAPVGLIEKDALCHVTKIGTNLHFIMNEQDYDLGATTVEASVMRRIISMGAYAIIMPDKKYINTKNPSDKGNIEAHYTSPDGAITTFSLCKADGTPYIPDLISPEQPTEGLANGFLWLDTSTTPNSLKQYSSASGMWSSIATTFVKISCTGIGAGFNQWDGVKISGITVEALSDLNNTMVIYDKGDDYIVVVGILNDAGGVSQSEPITVTRTMPDMDFIIECNNRLWGCRYGLNSDNEVVNELYASKLGDFKNWNCFLGISTDSYYVSLGTDGAFTGAISYLGYPTFFKEDCIHTVYGNMPANFQVKTTACRGVQKGSENSLAMVNETLYYKSRTGICAYNGALPTEISDVLGEKSYSNAVACAHKGKYYISMMDNSDRQYVLFVFDTEKGMWHKEDNTQIKDFCPINDEIYFIDTEGNIKTMFGSGTKDTEPVEWMAETGVIGCSSPDKKYVSRISIRLNMSIGTKITFSIEYDSSGEWKKVCSLTGRNLRTFTIPIRPKRCDHFRLRITGMGNAKIFSISKTIEQGSDQ